MKKQVTHTLRIASFCHQWRVICHVFVSILRTSAWSFTASSDTLGWAWGHSCLQQGNSRGCGVSRCLALISPFYLKSGRGWILLLGPKSEILSRAWPFPLLKRKEMVFYGPLWQDVCADPSRMMWMAFGVAAGHSTGAQKITWNEIAEKEWIVNGLESTE